MQRFLDIILRSIILNAAMFVMFSAFSLVLCGDWLFMNFDCELGKFLVFLFCFINIIHWLMEILLLFFKPTNYEDL